MKAYIDSSVILRVIFGEESALKFPKNIHIYGASEILKIECFRTIERMKQTLTISEDEIAKKHSALHKILKTLHIIKFSDAIIKRACESFPITLKSLDAIHLSAAILWQQEELSEILFLTHDIQLSKAAIAMGFEVLGTELH
jgi:hypothetical protein